MKSSHFLKLVALVIIGLIGVSGWYLYQTNKVNDKINVDTVLLSDTVGTKTEVSDYKDTANVFSLRYPKDWKYEQRQQGTDGVIQEIDWKSVSQPVRFIPSNPVQDNSVMVQVLPDQASADTIVNGWQTAKHTVKQTKINGYPAKYTDITFKGDAEGYTDHYYIVTKAGKPIMFNFRSRYNHDNVTPVVKWDDSKDMQGFLTIVKSVRYLL
jgi:hypothetical protein